MITTQAEFNSIIANVLAVRYLQLYGGSVEMTQGAINDACQYGFQITMKDPQDPASPLVMKLVTIAEAQKLMDQIRRQS
jgi:hypothetical protein